ncbi:efflux RND transporter periplasmic adaptor subunit [uncultured Roseovarius sp.]|uniref:efflux RND transporter periplasmic adaptor subunit n=1 Tax=uncultured Roseovarius sp. TaxID=293344 RepID=UPI0026010724|nr:efflux RND transporter periplasmic adaptor subunit [uncultured Roseovarius sp.]
MSVWKQLLLLCLLAGGAYGGYEAYRIYFAPTVVAETPASGARPVTVELARAETRLLQQTIEAVGTTRALQSIEIVPEVDGRLIELAIEPGAKVEKGDILARLDDTIERADLVEAEAVLTEQRQTVERIRQLRLTNAVSQASQEEATARLAEATAEVERARRRLADRIISAPFAGVVGLTNYDVGARVSEGQVLTRLDDLSEVEVEFSLPETLFAQIERGQKLTARSAAFPGREFTGTIDAVDNRIDPLSRAFRTRALIPNPDSTLPAGMFLSLKLVLSETEEFVVPEEAIIFQAAETYVFVNENGKAARRVVVTGQRLDGAIAVTSGLSSGEEVIIRGLQRVRPGSDLKIKGEDTGATAETVAKTPEKAT